MKTLNLTLRQLKATQLALFAWGPTLPVSNSCVLARLHPESKEPWADRLGNQEKRPEGRPG